MHKFKHTAFDITTSIIFVCIALALLMSGCNKNSNFSVFEEKHPLHSKPYQSLSVEDSENAPSLLTEGCEGSSDYCSISVFAAGVDNSSPIADSIRNDILQAYSLSFGTVRHIQISLATDGEDIWAIAYVFAEDAYGESRARIYSVKDTVESLLVKVVFEAYWPYSQGMTVDTMEYDGKYLVCGAVADSHCTIAGDVVLDLSRRSYMVIEGTDLTISVPVSSDEVLCGYICILDSEPTEMTVYDETDDVLFRLSERFNEVIIRSH